MHQLVHLTAYVSMHWSAAGGVSEYRGDELPDSLYIVRDALLMWAEAIKPHICCLGARWRIAENFGQSLLTSPSAILNRFGFGECWSPSPWQLPGSAEFVIAHKMKGTCCAYLFIFRGERWLIQGACIERPQRWLEWYYGPQGLSPVIHHLAACPARETIQTSLWMSITEALFGQR